MTYARNSNKGGRTGRETDVDPALVLLTDGRIIAAQHQFTNEKGVLCAHLGDRSNGIGLKLNEWVAVARTEDAARALGVEEEFTAAFTDDDDGSGHKSARILFAASDPPVFDSEESETVADGGRDITDIEPVNGGEGQW